MPQKYRILASHADAKPKAGTVTAKGLFGKKKSKASKKKAY
jgi:hypothetical protein